MLTQKKGIRKIKIDAEKLTKIISFENLNFNKGAPKNVKGVLAAYVKHIEREIKKYKKVCSNINVCHAKVTGEKTIEYKVEDYISIKPIKKNIFVKELGYPLFYEYKITISNLIVNIKEKVDFDLSPANLGNYHPGDHKDNNIPCWIKLFFEFKDNCFECKESKRAPITISFSHYIALSFIENHFRGTNLYISTESGVETLLDFQGNFSKKGYAFISIRDSLKQHFSFLKFEIEAAKRNYAARQLESFMNKYNTPKKIEKEAVYKHITDDNNYDLNKITPEQIKVPEKQCIVRIANNQFNSLSISGKGDFYFRGKNIIQIFSTFNPRLVGLEPSLLPTIYWGAHQKLNGSEKYIFFICKKIFIKLKFLLLHSKLFIYLKKKLLILKFFLWHSKLVAILKKLFSKLLNLLSYEEKIGAESFFAHKKIFSVLKQRAIANGDVMQEMILQREIAKCDHAIAKSERWRAWQDRMIFWFSKWISNYGTSWIRPLGWLAALNLIIVVLALYTNSDYDFKMWVVFWKLFNPTNSLANMPWPKTDINAWISFLFIFQKVVLAFTLYEMIKIFRRFGRR